MNLTQTNAFSTTSVGYYGSVEIILKNGTKKYNLKLHNAGTTALGDLISIALCGDLQNLNTLQTRCANQLTFDFSQDGEWRPLLSVSTPLTSAVWGISVPQDAEESQFYNNINVIGKTRFSCIISTETVLTGFSSLVNQGTARLCLLNSRNEVLATIERNGPDDDTFSLLYTALTSGQDALINWTMYILNYVSNEEGNNS